MISSTVEDLEDERDAVDYAVRHFQFERFRSECLGARSRSPREICEEMAADCDLQIVILGRRYGWVIPDLGISVTEREFDVARASDTRKVLVFVKDMPPQEREERATAFLAKATDFTTGLYRPQPFRDCAQLRRQVRSAMSTWISERILEGRLSHHNVFALNDPGSSLRSFFILGLVLMAVLVALALAPGLGISRSFAPSPADLLDAWQARKLDLISAVSKTWFLSFLGYLSGVMLGGVAFISAAYLGRQRAELISILWVAVLSSLSALTFLYGQFWIPSGRSGIWSAMFAVAAIAGVIARREIATTPSDKESGGPSFDHRMLVNMLLSPTLPLLFVAAVGVQFFSEVLWPDVRGVGFLYVTGTSRFEPAVSFLGILLLVAVVMVTFFALNAVQGYVGWSRVVWPNMTQIRQ